jgi:hypothetical protein
VPEIVCFSGSVAGKTIVPPDYFTAAQADSHKNKSGSFAARFYVRNRSFVPRDDGRTKRKRALHLHAAPKSGEVTMKSDEAMPQACRPV